MIPMTFNGDPGYTNKGRDLNRFRCELNAYHNLRGFGVCYRGFVPAFYGHIDRVDRSMTPVRHHDIYPKNMLVVSGTRIVWVDFDVATTFSSMGLCEKAYCDKTELVKSFGKLLNDDKRHGLPPNTKYY
ncbi:hypothetical protein N7532_000001 [Penicillium argentinense]|uniref:Protein kinase domain-containing protein n=1 Tax=Penicillium argentinense TaxID=1131581 RepID=A0A9W9G4E3_9EURO|nr:uncharacterized protein N7532_000001 [Penicillium argentinense]KAJ5111956.1 hypothetical protein N7532_000001 [Penicillium argentinense]